MIILEITIRLIQLLKNLHKDSKISKIIMTESQKNLALVKYKIGVTKFFDLNSTEFRNQYLTLKAKEQSKLRSYSTPIPYNKTLKAPVAYDFVKIGAVQNVKDQGKCGSSWAFAIISNIESQNIIKNKINEHYSEQQLIDCDLLDKGCNGGYIQNAFEYLLQNGIMKDRDYPYRGKDEECKFSSDKVAAKISGYQLADSINEDDIQNILFQSGPLTASIVGQPFQFYVGGIFDVESRDDCDTNYYSNLNHAVTLVGYGSENGKDYWLVKNSWGKNWGEQGYFRIAKGKGVCGINLEVSNVKLN